jgi:hypothetical protein
VPARVVLGAAAGTVSTIGSSSLVDVDATAPLLRPAQGGGLVLDTIVAAVGAAVAAYGERPQQGCDEGMLGRLLHGWGLRGRSVSVEDACCCCRCPSAASPGSRRGGQG